MTKMHDQRAEAIARITAVRDEVLAREAAAVESAAKKAKREAANLKKYDKNGNGKLDADEEAQMKKDQAEAKAKKEAEKNKK